MIDEQQVYEEFEKALEEALIYYSTSANVTYEQLNIFIEEKVWESLEKYNRMQIKTKEKFFEALYNETSVDEYIKGITELWNIDHSYMDESIKELQKMVIQKDFQNAELYGNKKVTTRSIKLENSWQDYVLRREDFYQLNPERDFRTMEQRYVNRHIKLYKTMLDRYKGKTNLAEELSNFMKRYDALDKSVPYFSHTTGDIVRWVDVGTYNSMLYNVNLTRSAWNRSYYDAALLGNHLWYLPAHTYSCPHCAFYQGYVYTDHDPNARETNILMQYGKPGYWYQQDAIEDKGNTGLGIGHPNCKHVWVSFWSAEQIQEEKYSSNQWKEKYEIKQQIQSLDLKKSRLLADRRIYRNLGQQDLVDKTTEQIKRLRDKMKELESQL